MDATHPRWREFKFTLYRIFRNPSALIGFTLLLMFVAVAFLAPVLAPPKYVHDPYRMPHKGYSPTPKPPDTERILGTTSGQYDIYYGVIWGTRTAFKIGLFVVLIAGVVGGAAMTLALSSRELYEQDQRRTAINQNRIDRRDRPEERIPLGRIGSEEEIADVIVFVASHASRYLTGQEIVVDGGLVINGTVGHALDE